MKYTEYEVEDCDTSTSESFAKAVKVFPVYVYPEWNNSFHASDSYIVANEAKQDRDCLLANNRKELRAAVQSLVDQRVRAAHELFKLSREY